MYQDGVGKQGQNNWKSVQMPLGSNVTRNIEPHASMSTNAGFGVMHAGGGGGGGDDGGVVTVLV